MSDTKDIKLSTVMITTHDSTFILFHFQVILLVLTIENCSHLTYFSKCSIAAGIPLQMLWALIGWIAVSF